MSMLMTAPPQKAISLKGSSAIVAEFFEFSINSILFQRGLYPQDDFKIVKKYGLNLLVSDDDRVQAYLRQILTQIESWLETKTISKLVLVIMSPETGTALERWTFDIHLEPTAVAAAESGTGKPPQNFKSEQQIHLEIAAILRQITASVSFLPILGDEPLSFNILAYTDTSSSLPPQWSTIAPSSDRYALPDAEQVKLRSFSTSVHKVDALVSYRIGDELI